MIQLKAEDYHGGTEKYILVLNWIPDAGYRILLNDARRAKDDE